MINDDIGYLATPFEWYWWTASQPLLKISWSECNNSSRSLGNALCRRIAARFMCHCINSKLTFLRWCIIATYYGECGLSEICPSFIMVCIHLCIFWQFYMMLDYSFRKAIYRYLRSYNKGGSGTCPRRSRKTSISLVKICTSSVDRGRSRTR